ncbi:FAD-dependent pyridine nucleotide-disulfide oxidoreductase [Paenibacillus curdlanolyticus YK9]|uniref:FAD-dependent pyridine nucleotide-disulfide oxidoreductase n=1 Tax=Paenibacillus curdlanolyticus YK9 TaxID=717606 RepID=E0I592_9BACL|nr:NAD(P)/FAD-dependent oxidoreductase [Paenibacillus curdlanolyticus]EFM12134.1 FAD-dependent pyridine nucleotide-disulfide oxidoreductase [Paenibacillus curdlanolyticus YK9]
MIYDCAIIGGGPAGLNAALVLGRARRTVALFDNDQPRNAVTHASHGFLTRDGVTPAEFRRIAYEEVLQYPTVEHRAQTVISIRKLAEGFEITDGNDQRIQSKKLLIATGLKDILPDLSGVKELYGKSLFQCPYCDGWELRDQPLIVISEQPHVFHMAKLLYKWSKDLVICTNGQSILTDEEKQLLASRDIMVTEQQVSALHGDANGKLQQVEFTDGTRIARSGGFITPQWTSVHAQWSEALGYEANERGGIQVDPMGKSSVPGLFAAGETATGGSSQLIIAASSGSMAAVMINTELMEEDFQLT